MALNIKDPATGRAVRELAEATGETVTAAVRRAAEERLHRRLPLLFVGNHFAYTDIDPALA